MDANGARELARVLEERHGATLPTTPRKKVSADSAAPIFHWFGVEPPDSRPPEQPEAGERL